MRLFLYLTVCIFATGSRRQQEDCASLTRLAYEKPGNITVSGIFDGYRGENCSEPFDFGIGEMAAAVWTVTALERNDYLPGIAIGLSLFDSCGSTRIAQQAFAEATVHESCQNACTVGSITTAEIESKISALSQRLNKSVTRVEHLLDFDGLLTIVAELLTNLHWTTVARIIADDEDALAGFSLKMFEEGICVYDQVLSADKNAVTKRIDASVGVTFDGGATGGPYVVVVMCESTKISRMFKEMTDELKTLHAKWLLVPTDSVLNVDSEYLPEMSFSILPLVYKKDKLLEFMTDFQLQKDHMNHREATRSPLFIKTAIGILELLKPFRAVYETYCSGKRACPEMRDAIADARSGKLPLKSPESVRATPERIMNALSVLKMDASDSEPFLYIASLANGDKTEDAAIFQLFDAKVAKTEPVPLIVNERLFNENRANGDGAFGSGADGARNAADKSEATEAGEREPPPYEKHPCADAPARGTSDPTRRCGICRNFVLHSAKGAKPTTAATAAAATEDVGVDGAAANWSWRFRTWVAINASVASIGVLCTAAVFLFIVRRVCKGDILEGSPYFSFVMLLLIVVMYATTLAFSIDASDKSKNVLRHVRVAAPAACYALLFSVILSRSALVIISERDGGIMNHVNGCLQSVLCFFMAAVQVAMTIQFFIYNGTADANCAATHGDRNFVFLLGYSLFLLLLLAFVAPFTMRSKRNYREGTFFGIATASVVFVWSAWITVYHVLPEERDAAVALGLTATATAVLLSVFIPRTYLMATATVRDKITNTLPGLAYINASEVNFRSNQALYDSVASKCGSPKLSFSNPKIYGVQTSNSAPASPSNFAADGTDYVLNRRKTFIEVCRDDSPENGFDSRETPDTTAKITRF